jgi:hypothetical protein
LSFANHAALMYAGAVSVVTPDGNLPPELWAEYAAIVLLEPEPALLGEWVKALENRLGVTEIHRTYVAGGEQAVRHAIRRERVRRVQAERRRATQLAEPLREPAFSTEIERDLKALARAEAAASTARAEANAHREAKRHQQHRAAVGRERDAFRTIRALRKSIAAYRQKQIDARWTGSAIAESAALAARRGQPFEGVGTEVAAWQTDPETGAKVVSDGLPVLDVERAKTHRTSERDPLRSLLIAEHLTAEQYDAGQSLYELYDARGETLGSQMGAIGRAGSASTDNSHQIFAGVQRGKRLQKLGTIERAVAIQCRDEPTALAMLRAVCGERKSLTSQGKGRAFDRNLGALKRALDVASQAA